MASLDAARAAAAAPGAFEAPLAASLHLRSCLQDLPGIQVLSQHHLMSQAHASHPGLAPISCSLAGHTGRADVQGRVLL